MRFQGRSTERNGHLIWIMAAALSLSLFVISPSMGQAQRPKDHNASRESASPPLQGNQYRALLLVLHAIDATSAETDPVRRIRILVRGADLIWSSREAKARQLIKSAYALTKQYGDTKDGSWLAGKFLRIAPEDARFIVLRTVARHDGEWARLLANDMFGGVKRDGGEKSAAEDGRTPANYDRVLLAISVLSANEALAIAFARESLTQPVSPLFPAFLYRLVTSNPTVASQLYEMAVRSVAQRGSFSDLLYLSSYPFGLNHVIGTHSQALAYEVPAGFVPAEKDRILFLDTLIRMAHGLLEISRSSDYGPRDHAALRELGMLPAEILPLVSDYQPDYLPRVQELAVLIQSALPSDLAWYGQSASIGKTREVNDFRSIIKEVERESDPNTQDQLLVGIVISRSGSFTFEQQMDIAKRVHLEKTRRQLQDWLHFKEAQRQIKLGALDEAAVLASQVTALDYRAYLAFEVSSEALKDMNDKPRALEIVSDLQREARKAPDTIQKARALLGAANLFAKLDQIRAFETMDVLVETVNRLESERVEEELSATVVHGRIEGRDFASFAAYKMTSFSVAEAFRSLGSLDFDRTLMLANKIKDNFLRSMSIMSLSAPVLEKEEEEKSSLDASIRRPDKD